jgi:hypothetical protein
MEFTPSQAWEYICKVFHRNDVEESDYTKIVELMDKHFDFLEQRWIIHTPLLHEAAHQDTFLGSNFILMAAWHNDKWRPLFNSTNYLNKYDEPVWYTVSPQPAHVHHHSTPDTNEIRHQIKIAFYGSLSPQELCKYIYWVLRNNNFDAVDYMEISHLMDKHFNYLEHFDYLEHKPLTGIPLLHKAGEVDYTFGSTLVLMAAWRSKKWKPLFNSPDYLDAYKRCAWTRVKPQPPTVKYRLTEANTIRAEIIDAFKFNDSK